MQRLLREVKEGATVSRALHEKSTECSRCKEDLAKAQSQMQKCQDVLAHLEKELEKATQHRESLPPVVIHVFSPAPLPDGTLSGVVASLRAEWALWLGTGKSRECRSSSDTSKDSETLVPLALVVDALGEQDLAAREVFLAVRPPSQSEGSQEPGTAAHTRYVALPTSTSPALREQSSEPPPLPHCCELLRAALGMTIGKVHLQKAVAQAVLQALVPRAHPAPAGLRASLRPYQLKGFQWLASNAENGVGSLLADDMGLGKTVQAVALLLHLHAMGRIIDARPALVVAPLSVLSSWQAELGRWAPSLRQHVQHGTQRAFGGSGAVVVLTTYATLQRDEQKLCAAKFSCVVLDESQAIKNHGSRTAQAAKRVVEASGNSCVRVALSGTPVENKLTELHSLFEFVNPGLLGGRKQFGVAFQRPVAKSGGGAMPSDVLERLKKAIGPFLLRRAKTDKAIAPDLPDKLEISHSIMLTPAQRRLYSAVVESGLSAITAAEGSKSTGQTAVQRHSRILALMHGLQQACNHPAALPEHSWPSQPLGQGSGGVQRSSPEFGPQAANSGKTERLLELLEEILEPPREKVIVFTQYLPTLGLLATLIGSTFPGVQVCRFFGEMNREERDAAVRSFTEDPACAVMLISLQAGGLGLTLTAATHVVHFDRCWNPAKEAQATDRAHRIGQAKAVLVHRLTCVETLEERLAAVVAQKRRLISAATPEVAGVDGASALAECSDKELREILRLGPS